MPGAQITGIGTALPDNIVTNHDLAKTLDTTDDWVTERTGIKERRVGGTTVGLGVEAARKALDASGTAPDEVDLVIFCTCSPDELIPAAACVVQNELGIPGAGAFDLNAACSGFVYGLVAAHGFISQGAGTVLVVGSETLSSITDWSDRGTAILFGDGAGAAVVTETDGPDSLLGWHVGSQGSLAHILRCDVGGPIEMDGRQVFRHAVLAMANSAETSLAKAGLTIDDIDVIVPHQANIRIIDAACKRLGAPPDRAVTVLHYTGNTSSASIPLALDDGLRSKRIEPGMTVLLVGFGGGMTSASAVLRWG
ncbi:MAG: ketoacyl-ACP synthase III [Acidimicrobiia bacterium]|nr:ketoacyl-ACP synthase III [Acidimicrobiia bacterium]